MNNEIKVSVICTAYNHGEYIRGALDGFVMQKTNFAFEVLINDDCSTDNTASIIREYEEKYPDIIKPVYQTENQYSKGIPIIKTFLLPKAKGRYIASCEGDDYWIDPLKLQKQYDFMEAHPDSICCFHRGIVRNIQSGSEYITPRKNVAKDFSIDEIIKMPDGYFVTSSIFRKKDVDPVPSEFRMGGFGDIQSFVHWSTQGKIHCLPDVMSVYRCGTIGSWTEKTLGNKEKHMQHRLTMVKLYKTMDKYYGHKYHKAFAYKIDWEMFYYHKLAGNQIELSKKKYQKFYKKEKKTFKAELATAFPFLVSIKHFFVRLFRK